ncbi:MAG: hypothetical protein AAGU19_13820 [Prolixibacteraceae bacterium]
MTVQKGQNKSRVIYLFSAICLVFLFILILLPVIYSPNRLKSQLSNYVAEATGQAYHFSSSNIHFNLVTGTISIDSLLLAGTEKTGKYYQVKAGKLTLKGAIFDLLFSPQQLKIRRLEVTDPVVEIFNESSVQNDQEPQQKLYDHLNSFFSKKVKGINIRKIEIKQAEINRYQHAADTAPSRFVRDFDLLVSDFRTDLQMIRQRKELFHAEEIFFRIRNFSHLLSDKLHQVHLDEIIYSIREKRIEGKHARLFPTDTITGHATLYWITMPSVEVESDDLANFVTGDTIAIKSINFGQSEIRIRPSKDTPADKQTKIHEFDLYQLFKNDFQLLSIDELSMENSRMRIESRTNNDSIYQEIKNITANLRGFRLDSMAWMQPDKIFYSDYFRLNIGSYLLKFNDQVHQFSATGIFASSQDSLIRAGRIGLIPVDNRIKLPTTVNLSCDSVVLRSVDMSRLFHHREMPLKEVAAFHPSVTINQYGKPLVRNRDRQSLLYHFIGNYVKSIYAQVVAIENGHLSVNDLQKKSDPGIIEARFNFRLTDFSIDSVTAKRTDKLFYATNLDLSFSDYNMKLADDLHGLKIGQITVSSMQKLIAIKNLHLFPGKRTNITEALNRLKRTELFEIKVPSLALYNTDITQAFFNKKLIISHFSIIRPDIYLELFGNMKHQRGSGKEELSLDEFYELLNNYLTHIEIAKIDAPDGQLRFVNHSRKGKTIDITNQFSLQLDNFKLNDDELNKDRLLFSDHFDLKLKDHLFKLSDNVHVLKAKEVAVSSRNSSLSVSDASLYPLISSPAYKHLPWHLQIKIPQVYLEQVDLEEIYFNQILRVGSLSVNSPVIEIYKNQKAANKLNFKDLAIPLPEEMKELMVGKVMLKAGKLKIFKYTATGLELTAGANLEFVIEQGSLKRTTNSSTAKFTSSDIETKLTGLYLNPKNIPYSVDVNQIDFSSRQGLLVFTGLDIRATGASREKAVAGVQIPQLRFEGLDPVDAFQNNRFHARRIYSKTPVFTIKANEEKNTGNPFYIKLPPDIQPVMDELSAENVVVDDASFIFLKNNKKNQYDHVFISLDRFRLDSTQSQQPFGAQNLLVYKDDNQFTDKIKHYDLEVDRISFTGNKNTLSFSGVKLLPRYTPDAFQQVIPYQTDHYSGRVEKIDLTGIDQERWFAKKELKGKTILISQPQLEIYRDKRTPFDEKQRRKLPQQLLKEIDLPFYFDSVKVTEATISYAEHPDDHTKPGIVRFTRLNGNLFPFTNRESAFNNNPHVILDARGTLMNSSVLNARIDFDMNSPSGRFRAKGSLSPFQMAALNPVTEFNAHIMIRSGQLNRFDFDFEADSVKAIGKLWFAYDDLRISILEQKDGDTKEAKWLSFLANSLMLRSKNPRTKTLDPDVIYFERDPKRSVINYWWKSIFSGAKNTFGIE